MRDRITATCICCGKTGPIHGRRLIINCYNLHRRKGTLDQFPRVTGVKQPWQPTGPHGRRMLQRYQELAAIRPPMSIRAIAWHMDVTERSVTRYAAAARAQAAAESATPRTEAA
ncbi:hypothetical protein [Nonomuraea sp. NPDC049709]|uniref:hypothetical protein n=1 Tax=Nonomuraea sp. NPDC049709 TaxID=3154736 RepID=UPI00341E7C97